jgi:hypothetical protein
MAIDIKNIAIDESVVTVPFAGEKVEFAYRLSVITTESMEALEASDDEFKAVTDFLVGALIRWDVESDGKPLKITSDNIRKTPIHLQRAIMKGIMEDEAEGEAQGNSVDG